MGIDLTRICNYLHKEPFNDTSCWSPCRAGPPGDLTPTASACQSTLSLGCILGGAWIQSAIGAIAMTGE